MRLGETTVDHIIPESLLNNDNKRQEIFEIYGLNKEFNINGFENWLPAHNKCNQKKGASVFKYIPLNAFILEGTISKAKKVLKTSQLIVNNIKKDKLLAKVEVALELNHLTENELNEILKNNNFSSDSLDEMIKLDNGYWISRSDIAYEGYCNCEKLKCKDHEEKVYCLFNKSLSQWVIHSRLYWKCYDEIISCPRCMQKHKRGHIGKLDSCNLPYELTN